SHCKTAKFSLGNLRESRATSRGQSPTSALPSKATVLCGPTYSLRQRRKWSPSRQSRVIRTSEHGNLDLSADASLQRLSLDSCSLTRLRTSIKTRSGNQARRMLRGVLDWGNSSCQRSPDQSWGARTFHACEHAPSVWLEE